MPTYTPEGIEIPDVPIVQAPPGYTSPTDPGTDLPEITVTSHPLMQAGFGDWLKPPKVYLLIAGAALAYYLFGKGRR